MLLKDKVSTETKDAKNQEDKKPKPKRKLDNKKHRSQQKHSSKINANKDFLAFKQRNKR